MSDAGEISLPPRSGKRKFVIALCSLAAIVGLASIGKLDVIAAGAIGAVCAMYNRANLQAKGATP